jgi:acyl-coenzyme A thioesterase PaaI-like protein
MLDRNVRNPQLKAVNKQNPVGLKLEFHLEGKTARTTFILNEYHQGLSGYVHEGILALLMDEAMGWMARHSAGVNSVTAKISIDFHQLAMVGESLVMIAQITRNTTRLLEESVRIERKDGSPIAEGTCIQYIMGSNPDAGITSQA